MSGLFSSGREILNIKRKIGFVVKGRYLPFFLLLRTLCFLKIVDQWPGQA